jgi:hypothetical protein
MAFVVALTHRCLGRRRWHFFSRHANREGRGEFNRGLCFCGAHFSLVAAFSEGFPMIQPAQRLVLVCILLGATLAPATAAEREDVRKVINLVTSVKMPYPESLARNRAKTERVWLDREGATTGCIKLEERRWCYEHIPPVGNRAEMLRIRNEPSRGVYIDALFYYIADYDLDGLIDVGSTTKIEALERQERTPIAHVIEFFSRSTKRGDQFQVNFQKMYDEGIQIALKYFGE